jgi:hypothetical protein
MRWLALCALVGCGDNTVLPGYDSSFDTDAVRFFGSVQEVTPDARPPAPMLTPRPGVSVCLDDQCVVTDEDAAFVIAGPAAPAEVTIVVNTGDTVPTVVPTFSGPTLDRNVSTVAVASTAFVDEQAVIFGEPTGLDTGGIVRVFVDRHDDVELQLELDGRPARYFTDDRMPDPARTSLNQRGDAIFFSVPVGEATLRAINGTCTADLDGWQRGTNEVRVPVIAGHVTRVRPICVGP